MAIYTSSVAILLLCCQGQSSSGLAGSGQPPTEVRRSSEQPKTDSKVAEVDQKEKAFMVRLASKDASVRKNAVSDLASLGPRRSVVLALARILKDDKDDDVLLAAAKELRFFGPDAKPAIPVLIEIIRKGGFAVWPSIVMIPGPEFLTPFDLLRSIGRPAAPDLIKLLNDDDKMRRYNAARTLSDVLARREPVTIERLVCLPDLVPANDQVFSVLAEAVKDRSEEVRSAAKKALDLYISGSLKKRNR
jgi:hypothetical protein